MLGRVNVFLQNQMTMAKTNVSFSFLYFRVSRSSHTKQRAFIVSKISQFGESMTAVQE